MLDRLPYLHLFGALLANIPTVLVHFIPRASSAHLLPFYLFYSHELFSKSSRLPWPNYHILPLITFRAYWPLSQPNEFTNSFPGLPRPIYFLFTSYCSHGLTISFIGLPIYCLFTSFDSYGPVSHQSCHFSLFGLLPYYFTIFPFPLSLYCWIN